MKLDTPPNRIRELRENAHMSQQKIADHVGVTNTTVSEIERGLLPLTLKYMQKIAQVLEVSPADLLNPQDNPDQLSPEERALVQQMRAAGAIERMRAMRMLEALLSDREKP